MDRTPYKWKGTDMNKLSRPIRRPASGPQMWILRLKAKEEVQVCILSKAIWQCMVHWAGDHSEPCFEDHKTCHGHKRGWPLRWKGYLHVYDLRQRKECFLEITPGLADQLESAIGTGEVYRGQRVKLVRGRGDKARYSLEIMLPHEQVSRVDLPPEKDPYETLCKLWGIDPGTLERLGEASIPMSETG